MAVLTPDALAAAVAEDAASGLGGALDPVSLAWIARPGGKSAVEDATFAVTVDGHQARDNAVILISNRDFPGMVAEAVEKIETASAAVSPATAARLHRPTLTGQVEGCSYAVFARLRPLLEGRILRRVETFVLAPHVVDWLVDLAKDSRTHLDPDAVHDGFAAPLEHLAAEPPLAPEIRQTARRFRARLEDTALFSAVEHGDFWSGNVLLEPDGARFSTARQGGFKIIDWGGSTTSGSPFVDLTRYLMSTHRQKSRRPRHYIEQYRTALGVAPDDVALYGLAALGRIGLNLNAFPKPRYLLLVERVFRFYQSNGYLE